jgi:hypothetical protein
MAAENPLANKSSKKKIEEIKAHTILLKAKEATIYSVNLFPKDKSLFGNLKPENNRIGRHGSDSGIFVFSQTRKSEVNYIYNVSIYYYFSILNIIFRLSDLRINEYRLNCNHLAFGD